MNDGGKVSEARIREYVERDPNLTIANGQVYSAGICQDVIVIHKIDIIKCPGCGRLTETNRERTPCCGEVDLERGGPA